MTASRQKPEFRKEKSLPSHVEPGDPRMFFLFLLIIAIALFVLPAIMRVTSDSGSTLDQFLCYGALIGFVGMVLLGARNWYRDINAMKAQKTSWAKGCKTAPLPIVGRHEAMSWWDDYSNRQRNAPNSLDLEMNSDQKAVAPNQTIVNAEVSQSVFDHLKERNVVWIYYMPESPLTFLLEEEL